jgi:flagellar basal-body rod modification protein FlgD
MIVNNVNSQLQVVSQDQDYQNVLGKDDFLKLLLTQLTHQDPFEPLDNAEFIGQMTNFSSLEQLQSIDEGIESSLLLDQSLNNALSTTLIGRDVVVQADSISVDEGNPQTSGFYAPAPGTAEVTISDQNGIVVRRLLIDVEEGGFADIDWDVRDDTGERVTDGMYTFNVDFTDESGQTRSLSTFVRGRVEAVKFMAGNAFLEVGDLEYNLSQVIEIRERES